MSKRIVYLIKLRDKDDNRIYKGREGRTIKNPLSYQLMEFADNYGFDIEYDAIHAPISFWLEGESSSVELVPLEVFHG